ncbi:MAG TPA: lipopolysaccharide heptosyltransferase II [Blastocatellia bacterium]|nr:lipopolysaccharide heptosyltransferase II [Blastocatellia bacterium]
MQQMIKQAVRVPAEAALKVYLSSLPREEFSPDRIQRILVFAYQGLGNFIMYTPALKALRERYPNARIDLQVGNNTGCEEVLAGSGTFNNTYNLPYSAGLRAWLRRFREVRDARYDLTINEFHSHSWRLAVLVVASGARFRLGHVTSPGWAHRFSRFSFVFNLPVVMREDEHEVDRYLDLAEAVGCRRPALPEAASSIHLDAADREFARRFLADAAAQGRGSIIGVQPGTSVDMRWKQWPPERFREVLTRLIADSPTARIILFGSPVETGMVDEVSKGLGPNVSVAAGKTSVKQVAALIEQCDLLLCNDSGLMHVAAAVGTPVVAIYGPTDIRRTSPLGPHNTVIRHELPCSPCFRLEGDEQVHLCPHHDCLMTITADEVLDAIRTAAGRADLLQIHVSQDR